MKGSHITSINSLGHACKNYLKMEHLMMTLLMSIIFCLIVIVNFWNHTCHVNLEFSTHKKAKIKASSDIYGGLYTSQVINSWYVEFSDGDIRLEYGRSVVIMKSGFYQVSTRIFLKNKKDYPHSRVGIDLIKRIKYEAYLVESVTKKANFCMKACNLWIHTYLFLVKDTRIEIRSTYTNQTVGMYKDKVFFLVAQL